MRQECISEWEGNDRNGAAACEELVCRMKTTEGRTHDCEHNGQPGLPRHAVVFTYRPVQERS